MSTEPKTPQRAPRTVRLRYVLLPIAIILAGLFFLILMAVLAPKPAKKPVEVKPPLVQVQALKKEDVIFNIHSQGNVLPRTQSNLVSEVSGQIIDVSSKFNVGGFFKKGEQILAIDDISYRVALIQARSRLDTAHASLLEEQARVEQAKEEWLLSGKSLDKAPVIALRTPQLKKAKAELAAAKANVEQAEYQLAKTKIIAPYDLLIDKKQADIGQYVSMGSMLANAFAVDYAEVRLPIKLQDALFLALPKVGETATEGAEVTLTTKIGEHSLIWKSSITRGEGVVNRQNRVQYVIAQVNDPYAIDTDTSHKVLRIGTFVEAEIKGKMQHDIITIPRSAINGANTVYLVSEDNKLHIQPINVLYSDVNNSYTQDDIDLSMRLITTKLSSPIEGMTLRIDEIEAAGGE
ncbi:efflux RND transporter periplasmic adaptor subunit [Thalassotalea sediminis]|uniref:efflux RND transporter periplasmic adaptor subunit n=1 Tax=Thalassotalea sediminis TaxID=1759089 RepID=UPI002572ABB4|nr:efflux RND transporter periplasmic adaptor subunit [Thalassotalea sediminis]